MPPPPLGPPLPAALATLIPGSRPHWWTRMLPSTGFLRAALRFRAMRAVVGDLLCTPSARQVPGAQETGGRQGSGLSLPRLVASQRIGRPLSRLGSPVRMRLPPPPLVPAHSPNTTTDTHSSPPSFLSYGSFSSSSLYPVQCELGLGRIHGQTLPLDLLFFISHNQRKKGQMTEGEAGPEIKKRMCY